ncbi:MspA family porin [Nocardia sp. NBC_01009]|uniref:MspA family porin n=1 Tax=Nocardia sp. NBC_01009 TaxID=2975996 RepID=UPI0038668CAB|nr:MspA family porin [Nocardia sp. NBC_01009]
MKGSIIAMLGIATAAVIGLTAATATADQIADKSRVISTEDGWELRISKTAEDVQRVPNLAATPFSREGFVTLSAAADISGEGRVAVNAGAVQLGYQIGCQADVSNGLTVGMSAAIGPNAMVTVAPSPGVAVGGSALVLPNMSTSVKPGTISSITLGTKALAGAHGSVAVDQVQIKIDACAGAVSLRSFATVSISTDTADNSVAVYGDPIWL